MGESSLLTSDRSDQPAGRLAARTGAVAAPSLVVAVVRL
jgi:hypothetical protein